MNRTPSERRIHPLVRLIAFLTALCVAPAIAKDQPNVLFIAIDDLNDYISPLDYHPGIQTPNFDRLAQRSVTLANAHCAAPACHPSRVAVMTGVHPTTSGIYRNAFGAHGPRWRHESSVLENAVVLSQHFRNHGYRAVGGGKIFHTLQWTPGDSQNDPDAWDDYRGDPLDPISPDWPRPKLVPDEDAGIGPGRPLSKQHFGAAPLDPGYRYGDELVTDWAIEQMNQAGDQPLFLAVGLFRPHIPFEVPQKWFDLYPEDSVALPPYRADDLEDAHRHERVSWHRWVTKNQQWKHLMRGYLASISYVDNELGRLLDALDASPIKDNTIIVLWTDHGFHIGEKDNWEKFALWDQTTHVPCFIHAPGLSVDGEKAQTPVGLIDLYPTLCELANLPIPEQCDGTSLVPILKDPQSKPERYALSSYQFRGEKIASHAVVDHRYRLIRNGDGFEELYDLVEDPHEFTNRIDDPELAKVRARLTAQLPQDPAEQVGPASDSPYNRGKKVIGKKQPIANTAFQNPLRFPISLLLFEALQDMGAKLGPILAFQAAIQLLNRTGIGSPRHQGIVVSGRVKDLDEFDRVRHALVWIDFTMVGLNIRVSLGTGLCMHTGHAKTACGFSGLRKNGIRALGIAARKSIRHGCFTPNYSDAGFANGFSYQVT